MNDVLKDLAVQSWCLRAFPNNDQTIQHLQSLGVSNVELCDIHCDFKNEAIFDEVIAKYRAAKINILSIGVVGFAGNEPKEEKFFKFAKKAGCRQMSASFSVDCGPAGYRIAEKLGDKYDVNVSIHNHGGYNWLGSKQMLAHVFSQTSKRIGLCLDAAWAMQAGENPIQMAEQFIDRLYGVHLKDFVFDRAGRWHDVPAGEGNLDLAKMLEIVKTKAPANCSPIIEYEADVENPIPALQRCVAAVRKFA